MVYQVVSKKNTFWEIVMAAKPTKACCRHELGNQSINPSIIHNPQSTIHNPQSTIHNNETTTTQLNHNQSIDIHPSPPSIHPSIRTAHQSCILLPQTVGGLAGQAVKFADPHRRHRPRPCYMDSGSGLPLAPEPKAGNLIDLCVHL